jgi:hypothetical protein
VAVDPLELDPETMLRLCILKRSCDPDVERVQRLLEAAPAEV